MFETGHTNAVRPPVIRVNARRWRALALAACALAGVTAAAPPVGNALRGVPHKADSPQDATKRPPLRLDEAMLAKAPEILGFLQKEKFRSVGVLNFQVQRGTGKARSTAGPLNRRMADRLEVALALAMKDESMRLLQGPSDTVSRSRIRPRPDHLDAAKRKHFFRIKDYAPAWGAEAERKKGLPAEAFL